MAENQDDEAGEDQITFETSTTSKKLSRCTYFANYENPPICFIENTPKEQLVLEHVRDYEKQLMLIYRIDRKLLLYPPNECGLPKFICSTMRPTQMPFLELYDWEKCGEFITNFISYEELDPPNMFPPIIPSPANILQWQNGDCFDLGIALCSLLIGAGYDAYCVHGRANRIITTRDEKRMKCPIQIKEEAMTDSDFKPEEVNEDEGETFPIPIKPPVESKFLKEQKEENLEIERLRKLKETTIDDDVPEVQPHDEWLGQRFHCWVLIKEGKRGVDDAFFIEPTTGRKYDITDELYENVEFVWNDQNFWIHMKPSLPLSEINWELYNGEDWEYVMLDLTGKDKQKNFDDHLGSEEEDEIEEVAPVQIVVDEVNEEGYYKEIEHVLDLPPPWCPKLYINRDSFHDGTPLGEQTVFYEKWRLDTYAPYSQCDGLVQRSTIYKDYKRQIIDEIRCYYLHRRDKLLIRRRFPYEFKTIEDYAPGTAYHWKQIVDVEGESRLITFYPSRHHDGLIRREETIGQKTLEYFLNRDDYMTVRSWHIQKQDDIKVNQLRVKDVHMDDVMINRMSMTFDRNPNQQAGKKIEKAIFDKQKGKTIIRYHYEIGTIKRNIEEFSGEDFLKISKAGETAPERGELSDDYSQKLEYVKQMENDCHQNIKKQENEVIGKEMESRTQNEEKIAKARNTHDIENALNEIIQKTIYDQAREQNKEEVKYVEEEKKQDTTKIDYLTPVLIELGHENKTTLSSSDAVAVKNAVMQRLKDRLIHRSGIIQASLDKEREELQQRTAEYLRKGEHATAEEQKELDELVAQANFRIEILESRSQRHEEQSLEKYSNMDRELSRNPLLSALESGFKH